MSGNSLAPKLLQTAPQHFYTTVLPETLRTTSLSKWAHLTGAQRWKSFRSVLSIMRLQHFFLISHTCNFYSLFSQPCFFISTRSWSATACTHVRSKAMQNKPFTEPSLTRLNTRYSGDLMTRRKCGLTHTSWQKTSFLQSQAGVDGNLSE